MKTIPLARLSRPGPRFLRWFGSALLLLTSLIPDLRAARISEPSTLLFGRIVQRLAGREFPLTAGELVWTVRTAGASGREQQFRTQATSLAGGRYSYQLRLPHEALAYDLTVAAGAVPLTGSTTALEFVRITLDGRPLTLAATAVSGMELRQTGRAGSQRVDLILDVTGTDSDGDGLPDWWEDAHHLDKWDASDAATAFPNTNVPPTVATARNFSEWRSAFFPTDQQALDLFATQDSDGDGLTNLEEYAFDLDPRQSDPDAVEALPRILAGGESGVLGYRRRLQAADLSFQIELSDNLLTWRNGTSEVEPAADLTSATSANTIWKERTAPPSAQRFFRVRILRQ